MRSHYAKMDEPVSRIIKINLHCEIMILSVIIPVYNVEATLNRCVESVLAQNVDDMKVILVDDGSPDECPRLCDEWAKKDSRIIVIHKHNGGNDRRLRPVGIQYRGSAATSR